MNIILQANQKIQSFKHSHKKTYYACLIGLWCLAPIEMGVFTILKKITHKLIHKYNKSSEMSW